MEVKKLAYINNMKSQFLSFTNLLKAKIGSFLNGKLSKVSPLEKETPGYEFVSFTDEPTTRKTGFAGLYKLDKKTVFIKKHLFKFKDMDYFYILNEASILRALKTYVGVKFSSKLGTTVKIANLLESRESDNSVYVATAFEKGKMLQTLSENQKLLVLESSLEVLNKIYGRLPRLVKNGIPKRRTYSFLISFPILLIKSLIRNPKEFGLYVKSFSAFYINYALSLKEKTVFALSHRDLSKENLLFNNKNKTVVILDWENTIVSDRIYDIATLPWLHFNSISEQKMVSFLLNQLPTLESRRRFVALATYHALQCLSIYDVRAPHYFKVLKYTARLIDSLAKQVVVDPRIKQKKSLYEYVNSGTLTFISYLTKVFPLFGQNSKKSYVICYHSISDSDWRFSTSVRDFEKQIKYVTKNFPVISTDELMAGKKGVVISFDDGYRDVFQNAFPILKKYNATATLYTISDLDNPNRSELKNDLKLMTLNELKTLQNAGWEIGSHTTTHSDLFALSDKELVREISDSKKSLEKNLGVKIKYFAYPRGKYNSKVIETVNKSGYDAAFTVDSGLLNLKNKMLITRIPIEGNMSMDQFSALLTYPGLIVENIFMEILKIKEYYFTLKLKGEVNG